MLDLMVKTEISPAGRVIEYVVILEGIFIILFPVFQASQLDLAFFLIEPLAFILGAIMVVGSIRAEKSPWRIILLYVISVLSITLGIVGVVVAFFSTQQGYSLLGAIGSTWPLYLFGFQLFLLAFFLKRSITVSTLPSDQLVATDSTDGAIPTVATPSTYSLPSVNKKVLYIILLNGAIGWALGYLLKGAVAAISSPILLGVVNILLALLPLIIALFVLKRILAVEVPESIARRLALFYAIFNFIISGAVLFPFLSVTLGVVTQKQGSSLILFNRCPNIEFGDYLLRG